MELSHHVCHRVAMGSLCGLLDAAAEVLERNVGFAGDILEEALSVFVHLAIFVDSEDQEFLFGGMDAFAVLVPFFLLAAFEDLGAVDFGVGRAAATDLGDVDAGGADFSGGVGAADFLVCADADVGAMAMRHFGVDGAVLAGLAVILPCDFLDGTFAAGALDEANVAGFLGVELDSAFVEDVHESAFDEGMAGANIVTGDLRAVRSVTGEGVPVFELLGAVTTWAGEAFSGESFFETFYLGGAAESHAEAPGLRRALEGGVADDETCSRLAIEIAVASEGGVLVDE